MSAGAIDRYRTAKANLVAFDQAEATLRKLRDPGISLRVEAKGLGKNPSTSYGEEVLIPGLSAWLDAQNRLAFPTAMVEIRAALVRRIAELHPPAVREACALITEELPQ